jgi:hypothetical protein
MRVALAIAATLALPIHAVAQPAPVPPLQAPPPPPPEPAPEPAAEPAPAPAPAPAPKVDPAYGEKPDRSAGSHDTRTFPAPRGKDVIIVSYPDRSKSNIMLLGGLGIGGLLVSGLGLYFHIDAKSAADDVSAHKPINEAWSSDHEDTYDRAHSSSIAAGVLYGVGGGLLLATAIAYIVTEPKAETMVIHPHANPRTSRATPLVAPTRGGAVLGGAWSF